MSQPRSIQLICFLAILAIVSFIATPLSYGQTSSASLSGIVADPTGARIPSASVVLVEQSSKSKRSALANADGLFNFLGSDGGHGGEFNVTGFKA